MTGLFSEPIGNVAAQAQGSDAYPASVWDAQELAGGSQQFLRAVGGGQAQFGAIDEYGRVVAPSAPYLDPETLNRTWGIDGHLKFDAPLPESVARSMFDAKRDELARQDASRRSDAAGITKFGAGLAAGLTDPLNLAAGLIPVVGEARAAGWLLKAGMDLGGGLLERTAARAVAGTVGGFTAQLPLVATRYALSKQEQADYSATDAMTDIFMGSLLGGGLHTAIGGAGDLIGSNFGRSAIARLAERDPAAREALLRAAVGQTADGQPVNLAPVLDTTALRSAYADRLAARGDTQAGSYAAYTPTGQRIELRPEVVELADLIASHQPDGTINPAYPHAEGVQPRDRTSAASQAQIAEIASRLEPERLGASPEAASGAPIVNEGGIVESGNGRVAALQKVYGEPTLAAQRDSYRAFLTASGHDVTGMTAPVLIGRRMTNLTAEERANFVRSANERATLGMNPAEQARLDADRAGKAIDAYRPGAIGGRDNQGFVGAFMAQVPAEERAGMLLSSGELSGAGEARIRGALLAHAYGDALGPTLERMLNGDVEGMKNLAGALQDEAGAWGQLRAAAARGAIPPGLDITPALGEAAQLLDRARESGTPIARLLAQADMMNAPSPAADALLRLMFRDQAMRLPVARQKLAELLDRYVEQAMEAKPGPGLFGEPETTAASIMRTIDREDGKLDGLASALESQTEESEPIRGSTAAPENRTEVSTTGERPLIPERDAAEAEQRAADIERQLRASVPEGEANPELEAALKGIAAESEKSAGVLKGIEQASVCLTGAIA